MGELKGKAVNISMCMLTLTPGCVLSGEAVDNSGSSSDESCTGTSSSNESLCEEIVEVEGGDEELVLVPRCSIVSIKLYVFNHALYIVEVHISYTFDYFS